MAKETGLPEHLKILIIVSRALVVCYASENGQRRVTPEFTSDCEILPSLVEGIDWQTFARILRTQATGVKAQTFGRACREDFARHVKEQEPDVIFFDGPVGPDGSLHFEGNHGQSQPLSAQELGRLLHRHHCKLLALTSCAEPPTAARKLTDAGVDAVLAVPADADQPIKRAFLQELIDQLLKPQTIEESVDAARRQATERLDKRDKALPPLTFEGGKRGRRAKALEEVSHKPSILRGFSAHRLDLPNPTRGARFCGRQLELVNLARILDDAQVVVLNGASGIGKTRLVSELAERLVQRGRFLGAVYFDAGQESSLSALFTAVASVMGIPIALEAELIPRVGDFLVKNRVLVIVDEFEGALRASKRPPAGEELTGMKAAAEELVEYLKGFSGRSRFVVVKRQGRLGNPREKCLGIMGLRKQEAAFFFGKILRDKQPDPAEPTEEDQKAINAACELLGNTPINIEVAAHWMLKNECAPKQLLDWLRKQPEPARQNGVRLVLDSLDEPTQKLLICLAVFAGRPDGNAVAAVAGPHVPDWNREPFRNLFSAGLIQQDADSKEPRCYVPPVVREAALQKLRDSGLGLTPAQLFRAHSAHYLRVAKQFVTTPPDQWRLLEVDWPDVLQGALWSARSCITALSSLPTRPDQIETMMNSALLNPDIVNPSIRYGLVLRDYLLRCHPGPAAREILLAGLAGADAIDDPKMLGLFCSDMGRMLESRGEFEQALLWFNKSGDIREDLDDQAGLAAVYTNVANVRFKLGDCPGALEWYQRDREISEKMNDRHGLATTYGNIALVHQTMRQFDEALFWYGKTLSAQEYLGDRSGEARTCQMIGDVHCARGTPDQALMWYRKAETLFGEAEDRLNLAAVKTELAKLLEFEGRFEEAFRAYNQAFALNRALGEKIRCAELMFLIGKHFWVRRHWEESDKWLTQAFRAFSEISDEPALAKVCYHRGLLERGQGRPKKALEAFREAIEHYKAKDDRSGVAITLNSMGEVHLELKQHDEALEDFKQALKYVSLPAEKQLAANLCARAGEAAQAADKESEALTLFQKCLELKTELGDEQGRAEVLQQLAQAHIDAGNLPRGLKHLQESRAILEKLGHTERKLSDLDSVIKKVRKRAQT